MRGNKTQERHRRDAGRIAAVDEAVAEFEHACLCK